MSENTWIVLLHPIDDLRNDMCHSSTTVQPWTIVITCNSHFSLAKCKEPNHVKDKVQSVFNVRNHLSIFLTLLWCHKRLYLTYQYQHSTLNNISTNIQPWTIVTTCNRIFLLTKCKDCNHAMDIAWSVSNVRKDLNIFYIPLIS